jgi:putative ABC transport system substrate-binding protein
MKRREFITLLGGVAAAWPLVARAQQAVMPIIGFLHSSSAEAAANRLPAFRQGLKEVGYIENENVAIEYRWADHQIDRLPGLAAELVRRRVEVIVAPSVPTALAAKATTSTIPVVFLVAEDPVALGLVASIARPGGNLTGFNLLAVELAAKRLDLLRELVPAARRIAALFDPANSATTAREIEAAAHARGLQIHLRNVSTSREIDAAFVSFAGERPDALFVGSGPFLIDRRVQLVLLSTRDRIPTSFQDRLQVEAGGLMSYGASLADTYRQIGISTGRILKGARAAELPVTQSTKIELVINAQAARVLGLTIPPTLLSTADEVIE